MIHHAEGPRHYAHIRRIKCDSRSLSSVRQLCEMPELPEGEDGKCDWCRTADAKAGR